MSFRSEEYENTYSYDADREREKVLRELEADSDRNRDREPIRDYVREPARDYSRYRDEDIQNEVNRLRTELNELKAILEERKRQQDKFKEDVTSLNASNLELLMSISRAVEDLAARLEEVDDDMSTGMKRMQTCLKDDIDELNMPVEAKCEDISKRIKSIQDSLDYSTPIKEELSSISEHIRNQLEESFGGKSLKEVSRKVDTTFMIQIMNIVGTMILLGLMCYFIIALTR